MTIRAASPQPRTAVRAPPTASKPATPVATAPAAPAASRPQGTPSKFEGGTPQRTSPADSGTNSTLNALASQRLNRGLTGTNSSGVRNDATGAALSGQTPAAPVTPALGTGSAALSGQQTLGPAGSSSGATRS